MTSTNRWPSALSSLVFVTGVIAAAASGTWAYRTVGLYGGPILTGYHRVWNPVTRKYQLVHETTNKDGLRIRRQLSQGRSVEATTFSGAAAGPVAEKLITGGARVGFSSRDDGVIDAWAVRDPATGSSRIEMSTQRDGKIDRWERYEKGQLVRVDLDTNGNGKPDRWMTYEGGILMDTFIDLDEDGKADGPPAR